MLLPSEAKKILLVEDDAEISELLGIILSENGYILKTCQDGRQAEDYVHDFRPDLILLDLRLPGINGEDIATSLKAKEATKMIPIILLSAQNELGYIADKVHADGFLGKPFDVGELIRTVAEHA